MMREVFEAFLTDPIHVNEDIYALWLEGHNANDALLIRLRTPIDLPVLGDEQKLQELLWRDTVDQYRLYEKLEHYLMKPSLLRSQLLFQIPPIQQHYMIERYYSIDGQVGRWLVGKKLTAKLQKDLDEISEQAQRTLKSCRRQLENLRRVYAAMEDRSFHGIACRTISDVYLISEKLASKYACIMFLQHARLEIHPTHPTTGFLSWHDLLFFAAVLMVHWIPQRKQLPQLVRGRRSPSTCDVTTSLSSSTLPVPALLINHASQAEATVSVVDNGAEIGLRIGGEWPSIAFLQERLHPMCVRATQGLDLGTRLTNYLRDLKAHLINDADTLAVYRKTVMMRLTAIYKTEDLHDLSAKLYLIVHGFLTIGAGLSQPKELKDLLENLITMLVRVLKDCSIQTSQLNDVFSALIEYVPNKPS
uniref:Acidic fibroblast growth factor intracellular-binding protein n=1 Tax=Globisporangium ultimum (strain ATCC 200006 / CBS 805.95 / DAOM BR144) TaxID=431595 RepID=K3XB31_GLOUD